MITFLVPQRYSNSKIQTVIEKMYPQISYISVQKLLKKKDIKINGKRISSNIQVCFNDKVDLYMPEDVTTLNLNIVYEDDNIIIINKPQEIEVLSSGSEQSLLSAVQKHLNSSLVYPCHRLDRNTKGLVLFAKDEESLKILESKIQLKEIQKFYLCKIFGHMEKKSDTLTAFLFKDRKKSLVYISNDPKPGYQKIITKYTVKSESEDTSELEIELITGRTHQIRAHLAFIGRPIIGDGKYGNSEVNKRFHKKFQELTAYKLVFNFKTNSGKLEYLNSRVIHAL